MSLSIPGIPQRFPLKGELRPETTALLIIDMQHDFVSPGGYMDARGVDLQGLRAPIAPLQGLLAAARAWGCRIVHTREGYAPDLSDVQPWKLADRRSDATAIGAPGSRGRYLIRGEETANIIPELAPAAGEPVFDKPSYGAFATTDLHRTLNEWGIRHVVLSGVTTDCCVTSTLREALDRGFECCVLTDCIGSAMPKYHDAAVALMQRPSGVFGTTARSQDLVELIQSATR